MISTLCITQYPLPNLGLVSTAQFGSSINCQIWVQYPLPKTVTVSTFFSFWTCDWLWLRCTCLDSWPLISGSKTFSSMCVIFKSRFRISLASHIFNLESSGYLTPHYLSFWYFNVCLEYSLWEENSVKTNWWEFFKNSRCTMLQKLSKCEVKAWLS